MRAPLKRACRAAALLCAVTCAPAHAAHPLITEDTGTQGTGRTELELGFAAGTGDPADGGRAASLSPQLSVGVTPTLDLIGHAIWIRRTTGDAGTLLGDGDLTADGKWRYYEDDRVSLGVRAGLDLPTGDSTAGLGAGGLGAHAIAIAGLALGGWSVFVNAAYAYTPAPDSRRNLGAFSAALIQSAPDPWQFFVEAATYASPDPASRQWPAVARTGAIYALSADTTVDVGYQARLTASAPRAVWLAGLTLHW